MLIARADDMNAGLGFARTPVLTSKCPAPGLSCMAQRSSQGRDTRPNRWRVPSNDRPAIGASSERVEIMLRIIWVAAVVFVGAAPAWPRLHPPARPRLAGHLVAAATGRHRPQPRRVGREGLRGRLLVQGRVRDSLVCDYGAAVYGAATDASVMEQVKNGPATVTRAAILVSNIAHNNEHPGNR